MKLEPHLKRRSAGLTVRIACLTNNFMRQFLALPPELQHGLSEFNTDLTIPIDVNDEVVLISYAVSGTGNRIYMQTNIDWDQVAEYYDTYVNATLDLEFWRHEARSSGGRVLELMCGTGRIALPIIEGGVEFYGLDSSEKLLLEFKRKLEVRSLTAHLVHSDARDFALPVKFDLIIVGFHSLAEVLDNSEKLRVLRAVNKHLQPSGRFVFSLHNPPTRTRGLDGARTPEARYPHGRDGKELGFSGELSLDSATQIASGRQFYRVFDRAGRVIEEKTLMLCFHLIGRTEMESLLAQAGFKVEAIFGDYDRSPLTAESPYLIYRCLPVRTQNSGRAK